MRTKPILLFAVIAFMSPTRLLAAKGPVEQIRNYVEGTYTLQEWHAGDEVLRPPAVDGRFVLHDGVVATILKNWSQQASKLSAATYGRYSLDTSGFNYSYEDATFVTETPSETKISHKLLFEGTRTFTVSREADGVHLRRAEGKIEFVFTKELLTYSENGKVLRVWRRVKTGLGKSS
jgi:hypothetical protein